MKFICNHSGEIIDNPGYLEGNFCLSKDVWDQIPQDFKKVPIPVLFRLLKRGNISLKSLRKGVWVLSCNIDSLGAYSTVNEAISYSESYDYDKRWIFMDGVLLIWFAKFATWKKKIIEDPIEILF